MRFIILGGGPVGLLCAIKGPTEFPSGSVWLIEKRSGYTRLNVPQIGTGLQKHLTSQRVAQSDEIGIELWVLEEIETTYWQCQHSGRTSAGP